MKVYHRAKIKGASAIQIPDRPLLVGYGLAHGVGPDGATQVAHAQWFIPRTEKSLHAYCRLRVHGHETATGRSRRGSAVHGEAAASAFLRATVACGIQFDRYIETMEDVDAALRALVEDLIPGSDPIVETVLCSN